MLLSLHGIPDAFGTAVCDVCQRREPFNGIARDHAMQTLDARGWRMLRGGRLACYACALEPADDDAEALA